MLFYAFLFWSGVIHQLRPQTAQSIHQNISAPDEGLASRVHVMPSNMQLSPAFQNFIHIHLCPSRFPGVLVFLLLVPRLMQRSPLVAAHR